MGRRYSLVPLTARPDSKAEQSALQGRHESRRQADWPCWWLPVTPGAPRRRSWSRPIEVAPCRSGLGRGPGLRAQGFPDLTIVQLVDDLDGTTTKDIATTTFGLDGVTYEIDLTPSNAAKLRNRLADFVNAARRTGGRVKRGTTPGGTTSSSNREQTKAIRD